MKNSLKRIVAMLCAVAMIAGGCFVSNAWVTKASDDVTTEWSVVSEVGDITSIGSNVGKIYYAKTDLDIQLNKEKTEGCYMLYIKVYLQGETAVDCLGGNTEKSINGAYVEIANNGDTDGELCWTPALWAEYGIELQTGVNELYLPLDKFKDANATGNAAFSVEKAITYFRIYNLNVSDCTGVILDEVKIVDVSPVVQEYPNGATATAEPTENVPNGYEFAGWYTDKACDNVLYGATTGAAYAKFVKKEVLGVKTQYTTHKGPQMLEDCDDTDDIRFANGTANTVTDVAGEFQEGEGAFKMADSTNNARTWIYWDDKPVNVFKYSTSGYLHFWFKIDDPTLLNDWFLVDIGHDTSNMRRWKIAKSELVSGWNEFYLPFAELTNAGGAVDFTKINMFRISTSGSTLGTAITTIVDDIRVVDSIPNVKISDCDSTAGLTLSKGEAKSTLGLYKEGSGAYVLTGKSQVVSNFTLSTPINLTAYMDESLYVDVYVDNPSNINGNLMVELGNDWFQTYRWSIAKTNLQSGWNELCLSFSSASSILTSGYTEATSIDVTAIDFFRILQTGANTIDLTISVDDIRIETTQSGQVIADCDSTDGLTLSKGEVKSTLGLYKEGSGAFVFTGQNQVVSNFTLSTPIDLTAYMDESLYVDIYIDNPSNLGGHLIVDLGNAGDQTYRWYIEKGLLQSGWNELCLSFSKATTYINSVDVTAVDVTAIDYFRVLQTASNTTDLTISVDDIRIETTQSGKVITDCDSTDGLSKLTFGSVTTKAVQYKEGSGAFILADGTTGANVRVQFTLSEAVDLTDYMDGSIRFSFYITDPSLLPANLIVDFGNDNLYNASSAFYRWIISKENLQKGWNEICLALSQATAPIKAPDITKMTDFRIYQGGSSWNVMTTIVDNIRIETEEVPVNTYADLRFVTTVDSLNYANVGFKIAIGENSIEVSSKEVYRTLYGVSNANETLAYTPDVFTIESNYFKTHTLTNIPDTAFDTEITITPFWTTQDGTKVYGTAKTCTVNGEIAADATEEEETDLRVVFSSDIHYTALVDCYSTDKDARMKHWVDCIIAENEKDPIDLLVINGDVSLDYLSTDSFSGLIEGIVDSESDMTKAFIGTYLTQVKEAGIDVWVMPGNHESYTDDDWKDLTGNARQGSMVVDNNLFIFLDNYNSSLGTDTSSDSTYTATSTQQITDAMDANPDLDVYLIAHYFDTAEDDTKDSSGADIDTNLQTLLTGTYGDRIKGLFAGHSHEANIRQLDSTWGSKVIAQTGNFSYYFEAANNKPFWGFRELIITEDSAYSQYISVDGITGDENTSSYTRKTTDSVWYY